MYLYTNLWWCIAPRYTHERTPGILMRNSISLTGINFEMSFTQMSKQVGAKISLHSWLWAFRIECMNLLYKAIDDAIQAPMRGQYRKLDHDWELPIACESFPSKKSLDKPGREIRHGYKGNTLRRIVWKYIFADPGIPFNAVGLGIIPPKTGMMIVGGA